MACERDESSTVIAEGFIYFGAAHPEFGGTGVDPARELDRRLELEGPHSRWTARQRVSFHWGSLE